MAIATPNVIGGYDYNFVDWPHNRYICNICHLTSRDPHLSECCGHLFCKSCMDNVKKAAAISNACPVCRDEEFKTFRNKAIDREIREFQVYCTNKKKGCEWLGELNDINNHLGNGTGCQFEEVKCSTECGKMIERRYLTSHVKTKCPRRKVNCQYCHDTGEHQFIYGQHKEECPKLPLPCPNKCEVGSVARERIEAHRKKCPLEMITCEYHNVGCKVKMARKDYAKHKKEKTEEHLMMTSSKLTDTEAKLDTALEQIANLTILMYSQLKPTTDTSSVHIVSAVKWSIKLNAVASIFQKGCQVLPAILQMSGYNKIKENGEEWNSNTFYTHTNGYTMCLLVFAAGDGKGKGTHLSVFLCLEKGSHDDELTWPLSGKFEIKLLNQINDNEHYSNNLSYDDSVPDKYRNRVTESDKRAKHGWGIPRFISCEDLHKTTPKCQYLKDDCFFFQITKL